MVSRTGWCKECAQRKAREKDAAIEKARAGLCSGCERNLDPALLVNGTCAGCQAKETELVPVEEDDEEWEECEMIENDNLGSAANLTEETLADGAVYAWGSSAYGQLGFDGESNTISRFRIPFSRRITKVAAGLFHSVFVDEMGQLHSYGRNSEMQLHTGQFDGRLAADVCAGNYHTCVIELETGAVCEWGRGLQCATKTEAGSCSIITAAGNATIAFNESRLTSYIWGWAGGEGVVNEIQGLEKRFVQEIVGSKFEVMILADGELFACQNIEVSESHLFKAEPLVEMVALGGLASLSVGNSRSGAISLAGEAVTWRRDRDTGEMVESPTALENDAGEQKIGLAFGQRFVASFGPDSATVDSCKVQGSFQRIVAGGYHCLLLSGSLVGGSSFAADAQQLFFSSKHSNCIFGGIACHEVFLKAAGIDATDSFADPFPGVSEDTVRAYLLYLYTERLLAAGSARSELLEFMNRFLGPRPSRLHQILSKSSGPRESLSLANRLVSQMNQLKDTSSIGNLEIICEDGSVWACEALIVARSPYMAALRSGQFLLSSESSIRVVYETLAVGVFVKFCCGEERPDLMGLDLNNVVDVLQLASAWCVSRLIRIAESFLIRSLSEIDPSDYEQLVQLSDMLARPNLSKALNERMQK